MTGTQNDVRKPLDAERAPLDGPTITIPGWLNRRTVELTSWFLPIVAVALLGFLHRWTSDDGFANFRVVDQILDGNGPVFNAGERVESFTSPLWLGILTIGNVISPLRLEYNSVALSIGLLVVGFVLATLGSSRLMGNAEPSAFRLPFGVVVLAVLWPVWIWATAGLEVGLTFAWLGACLYVLAGWATRPTGPNGLPSVSAAALVVLGLGWIVRPELMLTSAIFIGLVVLVSATTARRRWTMLAVAFAVPAAYQIFRMGYYGMLVSTRATAKEAFLARPPIGWDHFENFVGPYLLALPLLAVAFGAYGPLVHSLITNRPHRRTLAVVIAVASSGLLQATLIVILGGDSIHARLFLPAVFAFLAPVMVIPATRRYVEATVVTLGWAPLCAVVLRPPANDINDQFAISYVDDRLTWEDLGFEHRGSDQPWITGPGLYVTVGFAASGTDTGIALADQQAIVVATELAGPMGFALGTDVEVLDLRGFANPLVAHEDVYVRFAPGLEKPAYAPWFVADLAADPTAVVPGQLNLEPPLSYGTPPLSYLDEVRWAQASLSCHAFERLQRSYDSHLTPGRFVANVFDAPANTILRFDLSPREAYERQCGTGYPDAVSEFYEQIERLDNLPPAAQPGQVVIVGECAAVYLATDDPETPWWVLEAPTSTALVTLDAQSPEPSSARVFTAAGGTVTIETDGSGNYRVFLDIDGVGTAFQDWTPIVEGLPIELEMVPDALGQVWNVTVFDFAVGSFPMLLTGVDNVQTAIVPQPVVDDPVGSITEIEHSPTVGSDLCETILDLGGSD